MSTVTLEVAAGIGRVTLNRPERMNAIGTVLLHDLHTALTEAAERPDVSVILLCGAGRAFCAGDDLKEFDQQTRDDAAIRAHIAGIQQITHDLMFGSKIVVGAVHGFAVGGGFEWLLNCDLVVASDDLQAFFPEMDWGQFVTGGVTHLLPLAVGYQRAMELMLLGERQSAARLAELGLVNRVVPREALLDTATELATVVAGKSRFSTGRLKRLVTVDLSDLLRRALDLEAAATIEAFGNPEAAERVTRFATRKSA
ncbi:enoyl-CoA hydratase/isomerase family protein [Azospirillum sp. A29]|uniref:enoyl-CoA hydratase/isomerase family protein n=1 Tax=Azospirillum sp. A29 TaxID=3160606 RepID=UPI003672EDCF